MCVCVCVSETLACPAVLNPHMQQDAGLQLATYRYYDKKTFGLDLLGMLEDIKAAKDGSIFMLHA